MLSEAVRSEIATSLEEAYRSRRPVPRLTGQYSEIEIEDAYRIQEEFVRRKLERGAVLKGYKVGLTSKPMQEMAGSSEPDFSAMTNDLFLPEDTPLEIDTFFSPIIEMEIAFVLKDRLEGPNVLPVDVIRATDFVLPAIEIVDFRVEREPGFNIIDTVADLAACGAAVVGGNPRRLDQLDIRTVRGTLVKNGEILEEGEASAVLGNPVAAVAWLANKLSEFGVVFEPGDTIMTGSFVRAIPIEAGDEITCRFDQGLGEVTTRFV